MSFARVAAVINAATQTYPVPTFTPHQKRKPSVRVYRQKTERGHIRFSVFRRSSAETALRVPEKRYHHPNTLKQDNNSFTSNGVARLFQSASPNVRGTSSLLYSSSRYNSRSKKGRVPFSASGQGDGVQHHQTFVLHTRRSFLIVFCLAKINSTGTAHGTIQ